MPTVMRSEMEAGPSQKVLKVMRTMMSEGAKTPASLFAMVLVKVRVTSSCENSPATDTRQRQPGAGEATHGSAGVS